MSQTLARDLIADATRELSEAGVASPRHDAEALAAYVLRAPRAQLLAHPEALSEHQSAYRAAIGRRAAREPLQHIIGTAPFRHLELLVGPGVLIPRPETELLVDEALAWLAAATVTRPWIVDLGTGSGALALALASEWPSSRVWAVELDPHALAWATRNIAATGLPVGLVAGDMAGALPDLNGRVDVLVSNPPYLPLDLVERLEPEVREHDPHGALFAGLDALAGIKTVETAARRLVRPGGLVVVEHGCDQGESAPACFGSGWEQVREHQDLAGRPRYVTAVRA
jgi:release factor glutamine methyltransferase